jgi:hypothetical protein
MMPPIACGDSNEAGLLFDCLERGFVAIESFLFRDVAQILKSIHESLGAYSVFASNPLKEVVIQQVNKVFASEIGFEKFFRHE